MEGMKPPQTTLDGDGAQAVQLVCQALLQLQDLFLSLCNMPGSFPCSFHGIWVGPCLSRDGSSGYLPRYWAGSKKINNLSLSLCSPAECAHAQTVLSQALGHRLGW